MKTFHKSGVLIVVALILFVGSNIAYGASKFPEKPITLAITSGVGSGIDATGRFVAAIIEKHKLLPQPIVVETKTGGSGMVGMSYIAGKKKDPYYLIGFTPIHIATPLQGNSPVTYKDFTPICNLSLDVHALMVNANSKFKTMKDVVDAAKAKPETVSTGGTHVGGTESMNNWILEQAAGIKLKYISFGGGSDTLAALLGGHVDLAFGNPSEVLELVKAKKVRVLGVLTEKRLTAVPDWPTIKEQGWNVIGNPINRGIAAPAGIPDDARKILEDAFFKFTKTEENKKFHLDNAIEEAWMDSPTFGKYWVDRTENLIATLKGMGLRK